jgi:hypothetical protein
MTKECSKCKIVKDVSEFGICKLVKSGLYPSCNPCRRKLAKEATILKKLKKEEELKHNPPAPKIGKNCSKCKEFKLYSFFVVNNSAKDGKSSRCKACKKNERIDNREYINKQNKEYYKRVKHTDRYREAYDVYYKKNSTAIKKRVKDHYQRNKETMSKKANVRKSRRYHSDNNFNLLCKIRAMIIRTIKGRKCKSVYYVGVNTPEEFLNIMNSKCNNPNWISDKYQIDHIWQVHWFTDALEKDPENVSKIIHNHKNLRPIPASENINRDKYDYTSLCIEDFEIYKPYINKNILIQISDHFSISPAPAATPILDTDISSDAIVGEFLN